MDERALLVIVLQRRMQREQEIAPRLCELAALGYAEKYAARRATSLQRVANP